ncbi:MULTISPECIES: phosphopantetheine-binding protein [unclassified Streptomyces]|uniref:phosphopantetheine-binding protein n=1 Tax=unclassified Streptomyces TaxID=2593676 RepID=UPI003819E5C2
MGDAKQPHALTLARLRQDVAEALYVEAGEVEVDENVFDQGLDSVRMMALVEGWRTDGAAVGFSELAERPTLAAWATLLAPADPDAVTGPAPSRADT